MTKLIIAIYFIFSCGVADAQEKKIRTKDYTTKDDYTNITFLSEGDYKTIKEQETAFRVVIITSEIYDQLLIEKVTFGDEGGNKKIANKKFIDLTELWKVFNLKGEIGGMKFINWLSWDSFEIEILEEIYIFRNIGNTLVDVKKKNSSP